MGLFQRILGRQKTFYNLQELSKIISTGEWGSESLMNQYEKSLYVFAAINKIATKISAIDLKLFEIINSKGDIKEYPAHEILDLLYRVNPYQTRSEFWKITMINKKLTGEAFWLKVRNPRGKVVELWNLRPDMITIHSDAQSYIKSYELTKFNGDKIFFEPQDIIHFKEPNPLDNYRGLSPLRPAKSRIETEQYATNFQRDFFINNARPDALLIAEDSLAPEQRDELRASWNTKHQGKGKGSRIGILEGGMQYQQISITQKEMDYIESLNFTRDDILVAFGVPKSVITTDDVNLANANSGLKTFLSETINPEMVALTEVINEMLVIPDFGERLYVDFEDPTPLDRDMQLKEFTAAYGKWMTANEIREKLNLAPTANGDNLADASQPKVVQTPQPPDPQKIFRGRSGLQKKMQLIEGIIDDVKKGVKSPKNKSKQSLLKSAEIREQYKSFVNKKIDKRAEKFQKQVLSESEKQMKRVLNSLQKNVTESIIKVLATGDDKIYKKAVDIISFDKKKETQIFTEIALPFMKESAAEAGQEALDLVGLGESFSFTEELEKRLAERAKFFAVSINDTTLEKLSKTLAEGIDSGEGITELTARVKEVYKEFPDYRAETIARTESTAVNNEGFLEAYTQSKVVNSMEWLSAKDSRVRPEHQKLDGEIIEVGKTFSNGLQYPQEPNCRCVISPVV